MPQNMLKRWALLAIAISFTMPIIAKPTKKIVVLGDSLTAGYGVDTEAAFPALIEKKLHELGRKNIEIVSAGITGSTSASGPSRLKWLLKGKPNVLILELGANDGLRGQPVSSTKKHLRKTIRMAKRNKMDVILTAMKLPSNYGEEYGRKFEKIYYELAKEEQVKLIPFFFDKLKTKSKKKLVLPDGLHPNEEGHKLIADKLIEYLVSMI